MTPTFYLGIGLLTALLLYKIVQNVITSQYHARRAKELGCKPAFPRPYRLPFGIDMLTRITKADREHVLPNEIQAIYNELGVETWEQHFLGQKIFATVEPKNIQALLATQFNDFELGTLRRNQFAPLFGNGIFTADGKNW